MKKSFTLIEIIFVIVILAILAGVALPMLGDSTDDSKRSKEIADLSTIITGIQMVRAKAGLENNRTHGGGGHTIIHIDNRAIHLTSPNLHWPAALDYPVVQGSPNAPVKANFHAILDKVPPNWSSISRIMAIPSIPNGGMMQYKGPANHCFWYNNTNGRFRVMSVERKSLPQGLTALPAGCKEPHGRLR